LPQMPRTASHFKTDRIATLSIRPLSSIASAACSLISSPARTTTSPVLGSITSSVATRPSTRPPMSSVTSSPSFTPPTSIPLTVGDDLLLVLLVDVPHRRPRALDDLGLGPGDQDVVDPHGDSGLRRVGEAEVLERVQDERGRLVPQIAVAIPDQLLQRLLVH